MKIMAWKCDKTGKLFDDLSKYRKHLRFIASKDLAKKRAAKAKAQFSQLAADEFFNKVKSIAQLKAALLFHARTIGYVQSNRRNFPSNKTPVSGKHPPMLWSIDLSEVQFCPAVGNSHSCPLNGVENWHRDKNLPLGYPGVTGRVHYVMIEPDALVFKVGTDMWEGLRLHTGSGSGGVDASIKDIPPGFTATSSSYEFRLYLSDWPALEREINHLISFLALKDGLITNSTVSQSLNEAHPAEDYIGVPSEICPK